MSLSCYGYRLLENPEAWKAWQGKNFVYIAKLMISLVWPDNSTTSVFKRVEFFQRILPSLSIDKRAKFSTTIHVYIWSSQQPISIGSNNFTSIEQNDVYSFEPNKLEQHSESP
jgi:hypothetical protein